VLKAGGEKGSAFARERTITMIYQKYTREIYHPKGCFCRQHRPWTLQPIAVERGFGMGSKYLIYMKKGL